jgi:hypothetical protein
VPIANIEDCRNPLARLLGSQGLRRASACAIYGHNMFSVIGYAYYYYGRSDGFRLGTPLL